MNLDKLTGPQTKILRKAIDSSFISENSINVFLKEELDKPPLGNFTEGNNRDERTFSLIQVAEAEGWISELVEKLQSYRPNNVLVRNLPDALRLGDANQNAVQPNERMSLEKIVRNSGYEDLRPWAEKMSEIGQATCRIEVQLGGGTVEYGTGVLVGDDLVLTNYHVVEDRIGQQDSAGIACRFDYAKDVQGLDQGQLVPLISGPAWLAASSPYDPADVSGTGIAAADHLDFALLRLSKAAGQEAIGKDLRRGRIELPKPAPTPAVNDPVFIVQHPLGKPMALAIGKVLGLDASGVRLRYDADTEGGSSGSGVFNERLQLIALHHAGDPAAKTSRASYNEGIPIGSIAAMLESLKVDLSVLTLPSPSRAPATPGTAVPRTGAPDPLTSVTATGGAPAATNSSAKESVTIVQDPDELGHRQEPAPSRLLFRILVGVGALAVVAIVVWVFWLWSRPIDWTELPNAEIHKTVAVRDIASETAPKLAQELQPGDIEAFGSAPARRAMIDRKRWYGISLRSIGHEVYFPAEDGSGILVEWKKIEGCLKTKQPQTLTYTATLRDSAPDVWPLEVVLPREVLETARLGDNIWFRYKNNNGAFRYIRADEVERLNAANCPT